MRTLARLIKPRDWLVLGPASAAILVGLVLTAPWVMHGDVHHHLMITLQDVLAGVNIVLVYKLKVDGNDLWKRGKRSR
jgi:hypothetical protein